MAEKKDKKGENQRETRRQTTLSEHNIQNGASGHEHDTGGDNIDAKLTNIIKLLETVSTRLNGMDSRVFSVRVQVRVLGYLGLESQTSESPSPQPIESKSPSPQPIKSKTESLTSESKSESRVLT